MARMTSRLPSKALLIAACALGLFALAAPAMANPYFMEKTGRNCGFCHNEGEEKMKPTVQHLTPKGVEFYRAFREDQQKAIRQFSEDAAPAPAPSRRQVCRAQLGCGGDFAQCLYRLFENGGTQTYRVDSGDGRTVTVQRGAQYCMSHTAMPGPNCIRVTLPNITCR
jgi:hypothetical protein